MIEAMSVDLSGNFLLAVVSELNRVSLIFCWIESRNGFKFQTVWQDPICMMLMGDEL